MKASRESALRWYRRLLLLYPGAFRARYRDEMMELFSADWSQAEDRGTWSCYRLLFRAGFDCVRALPREWMAALPLAHQLPFLLSLLGIVIILVAGHLEHALARLLVFAVFFVAMNLAIRWHAHHGNRWTVWIFAALWGPMIYAVSAASGLGNGGWRSSLPLNDSLIVIGLACGCVAALASSLASALASGLPKIERAEALTGMRIWPQALTGGVSCVAGAYFANLAPLPMMFCVAVNTALVAIGPTLNLYWREPVPKANRT
jgi:hypothetical protein